MLKLSKNLFHYFLPILALYGLAEVLVGLVLGTDKFLFLVYYTAFLLLVWKRATLAKFWKDLTAMFEGKRLGMRSCLFWIAWCALNPTNHLVEYPCHGWSERMLVLGITSLFIRLVTGPVFYLMGKFIKSRRVMISLFALLLLLEPIVFNEARLYFTGQRNAANIDVYPGLDAVLKDEKFPPTKMRETRWRRPIYHSSLLQEYMVISSKPQHESPDKPNKSGSIQTALAVAEFGRRKYRFNMVDHFSALLRPILQSSFTLYLLDNQDALALFGFETTPDIVALAAGEMLEYMSSWITFPIFGNIKRIITRMADADAVSKGYGKMMLNSFTYREAPSWNSFLYGLLFFSKEYYDDYGARFAHIQELGGK